MGRPRLALVAVGFAVATLLLGAAGAGQAKQGSSGTVEAQRARTVGFLRLGRERGYEIYLYMPTKRIVTFYATRSDRVKGDLFSFRYSIYVVRNQGDLDQGVVRARFGSLGRVDLRFLPNGRLERRDAPSGCEGGPQTSQRGKFVGRLSFRGDGNYFHVSSAKGDALIDRSPRYRCEKGEALEAPPRSLRKYVAPTSYFTDEHSVALLYASARSHGRYVGITAVHEEEAPPGADVQLGIVESRHGMAIGHGAYVGGPRGTLLTSLPGAHPATATLAPPSPFSGTAAYSEKSGDWTGNLRAELPGLTVPLTGPDFHVHLCVANPVKDRNGCEFFKAEPPYDERAARPGRSLR
jgi:hypothetical protein